MNKAQFLNEVDKSEIDEDSYLINSLDISKECFYLNESSGSWKMFYSERGIPRHQIEFSSEDEAYEAFLNLLSSTPSVKKGVWGIGGESQPKFKDKVTYFLKLLSGKIQ